MAKGNSSSARGAAVVLNLAAWLAPGCGSTPTEGARFVGPNFGSPRTASIVADWNDVDAAVEVGVPNAEMAVLLDETPSLDERVFYVKTITDERGSLRVWRTSHEPTTEIKMEARVGLFGEPEKEAKVLAAVCARLLELKGVEWAPVE